MFLGASLVRLLASAFWFQPVLPHVGTRRRRVRLASALHDAPPKYGLDPGAPAAPPGASIEPEPLMASRLPEQGGGIDGGRGRGGKGFLDQRCHCVGSQRYCRETLSTGVRRNRPSLRMVSRAVTFRTCLENIHREF